MNLRRGLSTASDRLPNDRRRLVPSCERLEAVCLLSGASPVVSGYVFADTNNDGRFQATERPAAGTRLQLQNASGAVVATTTTGANGFYAFSSDATVGTATKSVTQTLTLPAAYTNLDGASFDSALRLFDPSLGTLVDVQISSVVTLATTLQGENTSPSDSADISGSVSATDTIAGLSRAISGTASASTPVFHASIYDGAIDFAGSSGVTYQLAPTDAQSATLSAAPDLAFYTAGPGRASVAPTATIHATIQEGAAGNTWYGAATKGSAVVTVTYDYTPSNALAPGAYTIVPFPSATAVEGKATSQTGQVVTTPSGTREIVLNLTASGSSRNDFGLLPAPRALTVSTRKHDSAPPPVHKPAAHKAPAPVHSTGFTAAGRTSGHVRP